MLVEDAIAKRTRLVELARLWMERFANGELLPIPRFPSVVRRIFSDGDVAPLFVVVNIIKPPPLPDEKF